MSAGFVVLSRADVERLFLPVPRQVVLPAPEGRFLLHVPNLEDGGGDIRTPNVKHLMVEMIGGRDGDVKLVRCESEPQKIKVDGTQVIVINKIDRHVGAALASRLQELEEEHGKGHGRRLRDF